MEEQQLNLRRGLVISLGISVLTVLILVFYTIDEDTFVHLSQLKFRYMLAALFLILSMWMVEALRIQIVARALEEKLDILYCLKIFLVGAFGSNVTPFTSGGGPLQIYLIHRDGLSLSSSTAIVMIRFALRLILFAVIAPVLYIVFNRMINPRHVGIAIFNILLVISIIITLCFLVLVWKPHLVMILVRRIFSLPYLRRLYSTRPVQKGIIRLKRETEEFNRSMRLIARQKRSHIFLAAVLTVIYWFLLFSIIPVILAGLGLDVHLLKSYVLQTVFFQVLPYMPTPGGSGVAELGMVSLFSSFVPSSMLGILAAIWRFFTYYLFMAFGGLVILKLLKEKI